MSVEPTLPVESAKERVGDTLRSVRESRGLTIDDVARELLVRKDFLVSIENMYAGGIPNGYLKLILRSYADYLDQSPEQVIADFSEQCGAVSQAPKRETVVASNVRQRSVVRAALAGVAATVVLVGATAIGWQVLSEGPISDDVIVEAGTPVNGARASLFASATMDELATQLPLTLTALKSEWIEVRGADGTIFRSRNMAKGEVYHPRIGAGWTVSARDGAAFVWNVGDLEVGPLGETASPVYAISVDAVASEAQAMSSPALAAINDAKPTR